MAATRKYDRHWLKDPNASWMERLLALLFRSEEIPSRSNPLDLFMRRFLLWGRWMLHVFYRSDEDPDPHDHPWAYKTRVLRAGYFDETWEFSYAGVDDERWRAKGAPAWIRRPTGGVALTAFRGQSRPATHIHRVRLLDPTRRTWTLVWTGPKERSWYFYTALGRVPNEDYHGPERTT